MPSFDALYSVPAPAPAAPGSAVPARRPFLDVKLAPYQPGGSFGSPALLKPGVASFTTHVRFGDLPLHCAVVMCAVSGAPLCIMLKLSADSVLRVQDFDRLPTDPVIPPEAAVADTDLFVLAASPMFASALARTSDAQTAGILLRYNVTPVGYSSLGLSAFPSPGSLPSGPSVQFAVHPAPVPAALPPVAPPVTPDPAQQKTAKRSDLYALRCWANLNVNALNGALARITEVNSDVLNNLLLLLPLDWRDEHFMRADLLSCWVTGRFAKTVGEAGCIDIFDILHPDGPVSRFVIQGRCAQFFEAIDVMFGTNHYHSMAVAVNRRLDVLTRGVRKNGANAADLNAYLVTAWSRVLHRLGVEFRRQANAEGTVEQLKAVIDNLKTCPDEEPNAFLHFKPADGVPMDSSAKRPAASSDKSRPTRKKAKTGNSPPPSPFGDLPAPCFRHILCKAKVRPSQPCPMAADDCHFHHGPWSDYSASETIAYFEEKLFNDAFPKDASREKAIATVKKWMSSTAHFAK